MLTLEEILRAPLSKDDLDFEVKDEAFLAEFETAWCKFLQENPKLLRNTERADRLEQLQRQFDEAVKRRDGVEEELQQQLNFFQDSCEALEDDYGNRMQDAIETQRKVNDDLEKRLDTVTMADHLQQQTLPWHYFLHELDQLTQNSFVNEDALLDASRSAPRPSRRALLLTDCTKGCSSDILLRAHRTDHALMSTHIKMLTKEVERYDKTQIAQELAGKFLSEYNVWSILSHSDGNLIFRGGADGEKDSVLTTLTDNTFCLM